MGSAGYVDPVRLAPSANLALAPDALAVFILNVGDGDAVVVRFPITTQGPTYAVIDSYRSAKTIDLIRQLGGSRLRLVCATHPHYDHIAGLRAVLREFAGSVDEFWDSGFRFTSSTYRQLIEEVERQGSSNDLRLLRPTSGFELLHAGVQLTVLSPSIALRNRYDTYGVDVNNASIVIRITYPVPLPSTAYPTGVGSAGPPAVKGRTVILSGDAQTDAWSRVVEEFPHLVKDDRNWARQIGARTGAQPLACDLFKVPHHGSKRGLNLELLERLGDRTGSGPSNGPLWLVVSSATGAASGYGFPHAVTQELMREVRDPQAQAGGQHPADDALGIHYTSGAIGSPAVGAAGSVVCVLGRDAGLSLFRLGDDVDDLVSLSQARRLI